MAPTFYPLAQYSWDDPSVLYVFSRPPARQLIATFPISFIQKGGDNTWSYVLDVVNQLVQDQNQGIIKSENDVQVELDDEPVAGTFWFEPVDGDSVISFSRGPEYFRRLVSPAPEGSISTRSDSRRSSVNQVGCCVSGRL
jgi:hypothetical protein